ncbi:MAG: HAMP domain-containing protein, partial [Rubrivivax sp.]|nr:HAMP domain-containing protein [Rubrivivax sp.]
MRMRTRILGAVLIVVAGVCATFLAYVLRQDGVEAYAALHSRIARAHGRMQLALPGPLYDGNVEQLGAYLDSVLEGRDLLEIDLTQTVGDIRIARQREAATTAGRRLEFRIPVIRGKDTLGEVRTLWTTAGIEHDLADKRDQILLFTLALMATVGAVIYVVARSFTRPIDRLTAAAQAMAEGDLERRIDASGMQELATLGDSFNRMRDAVRQKMADLAETNHRLHEEAERRHHVEQERDRQASILQATTDIVGMADPAGRVLYLNRSGRALLGVAPEGELGIAVRQLHPRWAAKIVLDQGVPVALRDGVWSGETAIRAGDGSEIPVSQVILRHQDAQGRVEYLSTIMRDISERKRTEQALRDFNAELERRVEQRTAQLAASRDEADRANHAKSEFLSRMSHELRTPMNAILGFAQLLQMDSQLGDSRRDWVREIIGGGRHLLELINDVLDLSRVESGRFTVSPEAVALRPLIDECLTLLRPLAEAGKVRLLEATRHCEVQVRADRTRLRQVLLNLLSNAIKYNHRQGSVNIVCVAEADATPPAVRVRITDSGPGLTPAEQARLFVPFERLGADERQIEGTGIGLVLSRKLMEIMGGQIGVESTPG